MRLPYLRDAAPEVLDRRTRRNVNQPRPRSSTTQTAREVPHPEAPARKRFQALCAPARGPPYPSRANAGEVPGEGPASHPDAAWSPLRTGARSPRTFSAPPASPPPDAGTLAAPPPVLHGAQLAGRQASLRGLRHATPLHPHPTPNTRRYAARTANRLHCDPASRELPHSCGR